MIKCRGIPKQRKNKAFHKACKNFANLNPACENFATLYIPCENFCNPTSALRKFRNPTYTLRKFLQPHTCLAKIFATPYLPCKNFANPFCLAKPMRNLKSLYKLILQPCEFQRSWCEIPTVKEKTKGHSKSLFKDLLSLFSFCTPHSPLRKAQCHLAN